MNEEDARSNRAPGTKGCSSSVLRTRSRVGESSKRSRRPYKAQLPGALPGPITTQHDDPVDLPVLIRPTAGFDSLVLYQCQMTQQAKGPPRQGGSARSITEIWHHAHVA